jgi:hypothetical protein
VTVLCRKAQVVLFSPGPRECPIPPIARSDSTFSSSIEGKVRNGYPSGTVFRGSNLTTTRQIEDFLHMLPVRPEIKSA